MSLDFRKLTATTKVHSFSPVLLRSHVNKKYFSICQARYLERIFESWILGSSWMNLRIHWSYQDLGWIIVITYQPIDSSCVVFQESHKGKCLSARTSSNISCILKIIYIGTALSENKQKSRKVRLWQKCQSIYFDNGNCFARVYSVCVNGMAIQIANRSNGIGLAIEFNFVWLHCLLYSSTNLPQSGVYSCLFDSSVSSCPHGFQ